jgi:hypothetical protein
MFTSGAVFGGPAIAGATTTARLNAATTAANALRVRPDIQEVLSHWTR